MREGFFTTTELTTMSKQLPANPKCNNCGLYQKCKSPKMAYTGKGRKKILVVGEAPGAEEDKQNEQFVGKAGKRLRSEFKLCDLSLERDCNKQNAVRCRPPNNKTEGSMIAACRPALFRDIKQLNPQSILLFGASAAESVLGHLWDDSGSFAMARWTGWVIPNREPNCWISVHYHPSYLERQTDDLLDQLFHTNLKKALRRPYSRPWPEGPPDYASQVELIYKPRQAAKLIREIKDGCVAFDYEANCLKPEYEGAEIVSCSVCWNGKRTFAFPWIGEAVDAMSRLLKSPVEKIAQNMKFEERWTRFMLKHRVRNWGWDTMLATHVLNQAAGITGLNFQAFVNLGLPPYDSHIAPLLKSPRKKHLNRIREIPLKDLLVYNGVDSLVTYHLMTNQHYGEGGFQSCLKKQRP
jgi:uracil-DNA glycosylase family 4